MLPHAVIFRPLTTRIHVYIHVGGGFHGKSTLLKAIERGVYNHIPNDGRELIVTDETAVKIRAEDGRYVRIVSININHNATRY
jgi:predicted ABC-class ATPase